MSGSSLCASWLCGFHFLKVETLSKGRHVAPVITSTVAEDRYGRGSLPPIRSLFFPILLGNIRSSITPPCWVSFQRRHYITYPLFIHSLIVHMIASRGFDLVRWKVVDLPELGCLPPCTHRWLLFVTWTTQLTNCPVDPSSCRVKRSVISDFLNAYINMCWPKVMKSSAVNTAHSGIGVIPDVIYSQYTL